MHITAQDLAIILTAAGSIIGILGTMLHSIVTRRDA